MENLASTSQRFQSLVNLINHIASYLWGGGCLEQSLSLYGDRGGGGRGWCPHFLQPVCMQGHSVLLLALPWKDPTTCQWDHRLMTKSQVFGRHFTSESSHAWLTCIIMSCNLFPSLCSGPFQLEPWTLRKTWVTFYITLIEKMFFCFKKGNFWVFGLQGGIDNPIK